jgi:hypothetical protein
MTGWSGARRRPRLNWLLVLVGVAALHLLLLMLLQGALRSLPAGPAPELTPVILVRTLPPPATPRETPPQPQREPAPRAARSAPQNTAAQATLPTSAASPPEVAAPPQDTSAAAPAAASAPAEGLLDTEASRRAVREAARQRSTGELGALASGEKAALGESDKMGQEIARGARGDCLKGEYAGAGMGLLSLPFWLIAELRDKCRR